MVWTVWHKNAKNRLQEHFDKIQHDTAKYGEIQYESCPEMLPPELPYSDPTVNLAPLTNSTRGMQNYATNNIFQGIQPQGIPRGGCYKICSANIRLVDSNVEA
jgi:hypothetical protein